jgi:hypothetical protein
MQFIHFSVKELLNSSLHLEHSGLARCKMPIKLKHVENETRHQSSQELEIRFGMLSDQNQSPAQVGPLAVCIRSCLAKMTPRRNYSEYTAGGDSELKYPED